MAPSEATPQPKSSLRKRLLILLIVGGVLIGGTVFYLEFWQRHPIGSGPVDIAVDPVPYREIWTEQPVMLLGLGDSITDGFGAGPGRSYFQLLAKPPERDFPNLQEVALPHVLPRLQSSNDAISGTTSIELLEFSLPRIETQPVEVFGIVLLTTGGNDIIHNYGRTPPREGAMYGATIEQARPWIENFQTRLGSILDVIEQKFPGGCEVLLANIYDPTDGIGDAQHAGLPAWPDGLKVIRAYNEIIEQTCASREHVHLIDIHSAFLGHGIHCRQFWRSCYDATDPYYWYFANLEDPNDRGYDAIRRLCLNVLGEKVRPVLMSRRVSGKEKAESR